MAKNISKILTDIMKREGEGSFMEDDGTVSFRGFNQKLVDAHRAKKDLPKKDVSKLTFGEAKQIFEEEFVNVNGIKNLPDDVLPVVLDFAFNSGATTAARKVQEVVGATPDGIIGKKTMKSFEEYIEKNGVDGFANSYQDSRAAFINDAALVNPSVAKYQRGLLNRTENVRKDFFNNRNALGK